jgi:anhydro-N-acetylmuramic acid kinase
MFNLTKKTGPLCALGAMSGTSLDGVDAAVVVTDGVTITGFGPSAYRPFTGDERETLIAALGQWPGDPDVTAATELVELAHVELLSAVLETARDAGTPVDLIGFHGQTLAHDPGGRGTHQTGDGRVLARALETPVVWDFRSTDVEMGGQGAPLAPFFHFACARHINATAPLAFLNLGGVGNITWIDPSIDAPETPGALLAFDTGPANAPLNDLMRARLGRDFDNGGRLAASGSVDEPLVETFLGQSWFNRIPPKSLDRNSFANLPDLVAPLSGADAAATLTAIAAASVLQGLQHCPAPPTRILVTGGGRKNATLMAMLDVLLDCPVAPVEDAGLDGDMLEAQAFAYLAVRVLRGLPTSAPATTGVAAPVGGGHVTYWGTGE